MRIISSICFILLMLTLTSCASKKEEKDEPQIPAEELYAKGTDNLKHKHYEQAAKDFAKISQEYPYSNLVQQAYIMEAYSYYRKSDYDMVIATLDSFIKFHPGYKHINYAYYLKALSYYEQIPDITRDQSFTRQAATAMQEVIARFPNSNYARDAKIKLELINDHLAGHEMEAGRFYLHRGELIAAINRFRTVVDYYQTTSHIQEALSRLVETYIALGLVDEAKKYAAVLGHNYPGSKWYKYSYNLLLTKQK